MALETESDVLERGDEAPAFNLQGADGDTYALEDFAEYEALLVVFTCNHCPYAQAKVGELNQLARDFPDLAVVGINPNDEEEYPEDSYEQMVGVVENGTVEFDAYLRDESQAIAAAYGARCTPDPYLFHNDEDTFRLAYHGRIDDALDPEEEATEREMREHVKTVLDGDTVAVENRPSRGCSIKWQPGNEPDYWN